MQAEEGQDRHHNNNESNKINDPVHSRLRTFPAEVPINTNFLCFPWFPTRVRFSMQQDAARDGIIRQARVRNRSIQIKNSRS
jgi:hypothetical protein